MKFIDIVSRVALAIFISVAVASCGGSSNVASSGSGSTSTGGSTSSGGTTSSGSSSGGSSSSSSSSSGSSSSSSSSSGSSGGSSTSSSSSGGTPPPPPPPPIDTVRLGGVVYTRVPRTTATKVFDGVELKNFDIYDELPETGDDRTIMQYFNGPGQLVYIDGDGVEHILYDCMNAATPCVPMDAMVDFSGGKVIFSVYRGTLSTLFRDGRSVPNQVVRATSAQMYIVDLQTFAVTEIPQPAGVFDTGPIWLPNGRIMFTSTRSKEHSTVVRDESPRLNHVLQLWMSDEDGSNAVNVGPHERDHALHPYLHSSGRVLYSSWQLSHQHPFSSNNGVTNFFGTLRNKFWVVSVDQRGGDWNSLLGAHNAYVHNDPSETTKALHFFGERANGDICTTNYYRGNNAGAGTIICWTPEANGIEGYGPAEATRPEQVFSPRNLYNPIPYATSDDFDSLRDQNGRFLGKVRDPDGLPDGNLLFSYGTGRCSNAHTRFISQVQGDDVACDFGIYVTDASNPMNTLELSSHPSDLKRVVDDPQWHEFMPRLVAPYIDIYGIFSPYQPALSDSGNPGTCLLGSSSMRFDGATGGNKPGLLEIQHYNGWSFGEKTICGRQGCSMHGVNPATEIQKIRFWRVHPHIRTPQQEQSPKFNEIHSIIGHRVEILGDVPLQSDGSFLVDMPCDMPYIMAGVDNNGRIIARDQVVQSLRPGEKRICQGCHVHSVDLGLDFNNTLAASNAPAVLSSSGFEPEYTRDIWPMLQANCASCHSGGSPAGGLALNISGDGNGSTYDNLVWNHGGAYERPETSRYVNGSFARESLLYWKAAGARTDGRSDSDYGNDIDFGAAHSSHLTAGQLRVLGDWLDSGAYYER